MGGDPGEQPGRLPRRVTEVGSSGDGLDGSQTTHTVDARRWKSGCVVMIRGMDQWLAARSDFSQARMQQTPPCALDPIAVRFVEIFCRPTVIGGEP